MDSRKVFKVEESNSKCGKIFVCSKCEKVTNGVEKVQQDVMCGKVETMKGFCNLGNRLNFSGGCEAAVTARTRMGWKKFRECGEILFGKRFSLWIKGKIYKSYARSTMLYGSKTWYLRKNEAAILRRAEGKKVRAMCGVKLVDKRNTDEWMDKRNTDELMDMLGLKKAADKLVRANGMKWSDHVLRQPEEDVLINTMVCEMDGKLKQGRLRMKCRKQVEENMRRIGLKKEDAADQYR